MLIPGRFNLKEIGSVSITPTGELAIRKQNGDVKIKYKGRDLVLNGVHEIEMILDVDSPEAQTDTGFSIQDNLALNSPKFRISATLTTIWSGQFPSTHRESDLQRLVKIWKERGVFTLICDFGSFEGVTFDTFSTQQTDESNSSYEVDMELKKAAQAVIAVAEQDLIYDEATDTYINASTVDANRTEVSLTEYTPVTEEERAILEKMWDFIF